ncbi:hypothetical protein F01_430048 [Burkholderia cenocepacia]|nr:hypothetical protein F01_430048 [Burkholderia cenocepacia]
MRVARARRAAAGRRGVRIGRQPRRRHVRGARTCRVGAGRRLRRHGRFGRGRHGGGSGGGRRNRSGLRERRGRAGWRGGAGHAAGCRHDELAGLSDGVSDHAGDIVRHARMADPRVPLDVREGTEDRGKCGDAERRVLSRTPRGFRLTGGRAVRSFCTRHA